MSISRRYHRTQSAARGKLSGYYAAFWPDGAYHIVKHAVYYILHENTQIPVLQEIIFQRLKLKAKLSRNILHCDGAEIRQAGFRADRGKFRVHYFYGVVAPVLVFPGLYKGQLYFFKALGLRRGVAETGRFAFHDTVPRIQL